MQYITEIDEWQGHLTFPSLQFINRFQGCPFMDRQRSLLFHQSNWTAEIRAWVGTDRALNFSRQGGATVLCLPGIVLAARERILVDGLDRRLSWVLFAFHLAVCSCFHYRSGSIIPLPAENLNVALAVRQYLIYSHKSLPPLVPDYFHPKMEGGGEDDVNIWLLD